MRPISSSSAWTAVLASVLGACDVPPQPATAIDRSDSTANVPLFADHACPDCIQLRRLVILGDTTGPGILEEVKPRVVTDAHGQHWVHQRGVVKVFSPDGEHLQDIGRPGQGPMEFADPWPVYRDSAGRVHILDPGNSRVVVIDRSYKPVYSTHLNVAAFNDAVYAPSGYVLNSWLATADAIGQPLHLVSGGEVTLSFGAGADDQEVDPPAAMRVLATGDHSQIISAKRHDYEVEVWTAAGRRVTGYRGPKLNEMAVRPTFFGPDNPLPAEIVHMHVDGRLLWVLIREPHAEWLDNVVEHVYPSGHVGYMVREGSTFADLYRSRIDVVDLERGVIAASTHADQLFSSFTQDGLLVENSWATDGSPVLGMWRVAYSEK